MARRRFTLAVGPRMMQPMIVPATPDRALAPYRVLDLTDEIGALCTRLLAGMGADVIRVEPPGGHPLRRRGPFYRGVPDPERSLFWFQMNLGKRSVTPWNAERRALRAAMGEPVWTSEERFATLLGRKAHEDDLERRLNASQEHVRDAVMLSGAKHLNDRDPSLRSG